MKPDLPDVLALIGKLIQRDALPALGDGYAGAQLGRVVPLLQAVAEEFDRAAARRIEELEALRQLFKRAAGVVDQPALALALVEAAQSAALDLAEPALFRVSALDQRLAPLRALLIDLHAWAEGASGPDADALRQLVWAELAASVQRRRLSIDRF